MRFFEEGFQFSRTKLHRDGEGGGEDIGVVVLIFEMDQN